MTSTKEKFIICAFVVFAGIILLNKWPLTFIEIFSILPAGLIFLGCVILPPVIVNVYMKKLSEQLGLWLLLWTFPGMLIGFELSARSQQLVEELLTKLFLTP